jgi:CTP synthase (UTP-ammonia lyase)
LPAGKDRSGSEPDPGGETPEGRAVAGPDEPDAEAALVAPVACAVPPPPGQPALNAAMPIRIVPGTRAHAIFGADTIRERFTCSYELNPAYESRLTAAGLVVSGRGENGEARIIELPEHPYFIATLFLPQYGSAPGAPHPFVTAFLNAAASGSGKVGRSRR